MSHLPTATLIDGRFRIADPLHSLIGQGAMGTVYRGEDIQTGQPVAVKHLRAEFLAGNPRQTERFAREGEALRQLNHPNIVKALATVTENDQHFIIMEYVSGGSLRELLDKERRLSVYRVVSIALDIADALTRTHRLNIIHRDLKPANVLLDGDGVPRLTDFGLALMSDLRVDESRLTQSGVLMGTMDYLSPEACNGQSADPRGDIWSFGVMLFEMLAGRRPFQGNTLVGLLTAILIEPTPDLRAYHPDVNDALADLIYRMLDKEPQRRIPSVRLVGAELEAILRGSGIRPSPSSQLPRPAPALDDGGARFESASGEKTIIARHNLPLQPIAFVGRERELVELQGLIADPATRLISVIGPGGLGKTRLALEAAVQQIGEFTHGVYFVSLGGAYKTAADLATAVADAVHFTFAQGNAAAQQPVERQLLDYLREKEILLLLDNLEEMTAVSPYLSEILRRASGVTLLVTARERLKLSEEQTYLLAALDRPDPFTAEAPSAQLFAQSARRVNPAYQLSAEDLPAIGRIHELVGGSPLGLTLAAGWVEMLSPEEIAAEISQSLDFLETDLRDVPERHRSLRAVFDYAWNLLAPAEKTAFQQLAIFRGGFTRHAAQAVSQASLRDLMSLANRALLYRDLTGRYEIQGLLQQYGLEQLRAAPEFTAVSQRHAAYFAALAEAANDGMKGERQQAAIEEIEAERQNIRAAWDWALQAGELDYLGQMINSLCRFYEWGGRYHKGAALLAPAVARLAALSTPQARCLQAQALTWQSSFHAFLGDAAVAAEQLRQALSLLDAPEMASVDSRVARAFALRQMARVAILSGQPEQAQRCAQQALELYTALENEWGMSHALFLLGQSHWQRSAYNEAIPLYERSLDLCQKRKDQRGMADCLRGLGMSALYQGRLADASRYIAQSSEIRQALHDRAGMAVSLGDLGSTAMLAGDFPAATRYLRESVTIYADLGYRQAVGHWSNLLGLACFSAGDNAAAHQYAAQGLSVSQEVGYQRGVALGKWLQGIMLIVSGDYAQAVAPLDESVALYRKIEQRDELAWALSGRSQAAVFMGEWGLAATLLREALQIAAALKSFLPLSFALPSIALLRAKQADRIAADDPAWAAVWREEAVRLSALALRYPSVGNSRYIAGMLTPVLEAAAAHLPLETAAAAHQQGATGDLFAAVAAIQLTDETIQPPP